jgi:hypothetical protein
MKTWVLAQSHLCGCQELAAFCLQEDLWHFGGQRLAEGGASESQPRPPQGSWRLVFYTGPELCSLVSLMELAPYAAMVARRHPPVLLMGVVPKHLLVGVVPLHGFLLALQMEAPNSQHDAAVAQQWHPVWQMAVPKLQHGGNVPAPPLLLLQDGKLDHDYDCFGRELVASAKSC